ncbi:hypothetical protein ACFL6S_36165 [Candidatus Poribacteria bacterium]
MGEDSSITLQHYLESEVQRRSMPTPVTPADFLHILRANTRVRPYTDKDYLDRIAQVAYERYMAQHVAGDAPTMIIVPMPLTRQQTDHLLGNRRNYVMVFGAESIYFQDTVHAFATDALCSGGVNVLGVHMDWLSSDDASVERAALMDSDGTVKEVAFRESVPIHIVQILHLPLKGERQLHRVLSFRFHDAGIPQINPYVDSSERADDKARTHSLWEQYERKIVSPKYTLIPQDSSTEEISERLRVFVEDAGLSDVVVQPNKGTEGYRVEDFHIETDLTLAVKYIEEQILAEDDVIVRERRGNVRFKKIPLSPPSPKGIFEFLNVTFRVNIAWNGSEFVAESGYAQVAKDEETFPASRGRGGAIVDINEALSSLYYRKNKGWSRLIPVDEDVEAMKIAAINAAYALNAGLSEENYLKCMGVDILLEMTADGTSAVNVIPVALEANPRPAGLSHSSEIVGISHKDPQQRISTEIFRFVSSCI